MPLNIIMNIPKIYKEYYRLAQTKYIDRKNEFSNSTNRLDMDTLYNFDYLVIPPTETEFNNFFDSINFNDYKTLIHRTYKTYLDHVPKMRGLFPNNLGIELKMPFDQSICNISNDICSMLLPTIEQKIYNSYVSVDFLKYYRNNINKNPDVKPVSSLLWHHDHHCSEQLKIIIYFNDVGENDGPFEILRKTDTKRAFKVENYRENIYSWPQHGVKDPPMFNGGINNRIPNKWIENKISEGYERYKITGKSGTIIIFDNNIIHKANIARNNYRDIVNIEIRPKLTKQNKYYDNKYNNGKFWQIWN